MIVAVAVAYSPPPQHSPILGHRASSHTCEEKGTEYNPAENTYQVNKWPGIVHRFLQHIYEEIHYSKMLLSCPTVYYDPIFKLETVWLYIFTRAKEKVWKDIYWTVKVMELAFEITYMTFHIWYYTISNKHVFFLILTGGLILLVLRERERWILISCLPYVPQPGMEPATFWYTGWHSN